MCCHRLLSALPSLQKLYLGLPLWKDTWTQSQWTEDGSREPVASLQVLSTSPDLSH